MSRTRPGPYDGDDDGQGDSSPVVVVSATAEEVPYMDPNGPPHSEATVPMTSTSAGAPCGTRRALRCQATRWHYYGRDKPSRGDRTRPGIVKGTRTPPMPREGVTIAAEVEPLATSIAEDNDDIAYSAPRLEMVGLTRRLYLGLLRYVRKTSTLWPFLVSFVVTATWLLSLTIVVVAPAGVPAGSSTPAIAVANKDTTVLRPPPPPPPPADFDKVHRGREANSSSSSTHQNLVRVEAKAWQQVLARVLGQQEGWCKMCHQEQIISLLQQEPEHGFVPILLGPDETQWVKEFQPRLELRPPPDHRQQHLVQRLKLVPMFPSTRASNSALNEEEEGGGVGGGEGEGEGKTGRRRRHVWHTLQWSEGEEDEEKKQKGQRPPTSEYDDEVTGPEYEDTTG